MSHIPPKLIYHLHYRILCCKRKKRTKKICYGMEQIRMSCVTWRDMMCPFLGWSMPTAHTYVCIDQIFSKFDFDLVTQCFFFLALSLSRLSQQQSPSPNSLNVNVQLFKRNPFKIPFWWRELHKSDFFFSLFAHHYSFIFLFLSPDMFTVTGR